ncbi:MAG: response regulator, partial [Candidatus Eisenbacteria bacterium]|nr:response regulator [Candidatus Eisenbacteria bacterium]
DATRRLRTRGVDVPIIALTAATMSGERERCLDAGCNEHLSKPVDEEVLLKAARRYLEERPVRVLLVEDDPDARSATAELLTLLGCHVRAAGNGEKALALAAEHAAATEIAFVDLTLPDMDGYRLIETLRAAGMQQTRFFSLSGREADEARAMACGVERHLLKPVGVSIIRGVLDSVR